MKINFGHKATVFYFFFSEMLICLHCRGKLNLLYRFFIFTIQFFIQGAITLEELLGIIPAQCKIMIT